jgi:HD-GYP domain-containing protein (c-di-GMP phosphodiesterase class II)
MHITTHHSKRCAYMALRIAQGMGMRNEECFDLCSLALMHDNGITQAFLKEESDHPQKSKNLALLENLKEHCFIGEENVRNFPLLTEKKNVILYHHEYLNGCGLYGKQGDEIPMMSQIICFVDDLDMHFDLLNISDETIIQLRSFAIRNSGSHYDPKIAIAFLDLLIKSSFWRDLQDDAIISALQNYLPLCNIEIDPTELLSVSAVFSRIIDAKSQFTALHSSELMDKAAIMCEYYQWNQEKSISFQIAANLHDVGKLAMPTAILEKEGPLSRDEFETIKQHADITSTILGSINGFERIHSWAAAHHERLNGSGYPNGLTHESLAFEAQLLASLDMYQALTETRPYRASMSHEKAINIMLDFATKGELDLKIIKALDEVFKPQKKDIA